MFHRSRSNLALWFTLTMGSILVVFAGVLYYQAVLEQLHNLDRLLHKKSRIITVNARYNLNQKQLDLENVPLIGSKVPPLGSEVVYARWYDTKGQLVQFFGTIPETHWKIIPGFHTIKIRFYSSNKKSTVTWLRQLTLPVYQDNLLIGYLQVAMPLAPVQTNLAELRLVLIFTVPVTLGVIGLAGWCLGGIAMQPIRDNYDQLQRFTANASHELRSPLSAIISNSQYGLLSKSKDIEMQRQRFDSIFNVAKSMNILVSNLLLLARHADRLSPEFLQEVDLKTQLLRIADQYATQQAAKHLNLTYTLPTNSIFVLGDADLLRQAVVNLLEMPVNILPPEVKLRCCYSLSQTGL